MKGFAAILWTERPKKAAAMATSDYFIEQVHERFSKKAANEILLARLTERVQGAANARVREGGQRN